VGWINLAQDKIPSRATIKFSRRVLPHGVSNYSTVTMQTLLKYSFSPSIGYLITSVYTV
jgi:hypothetical protein